MFTSTIRWSPRALTILAGFMIGVIVFSLIVTLLAPGPMPSKAFVIGVIVLLYALILGVLSLFIDLRLAIDAHMLRVGYRLFYDTIPLESIVACGSITYRSIEWGGYGIRYRRGMKLYNVPGDNGRAVQLLLDNGRRILFSAHDPQMICTVLQERRPAINSLN